VTPEQAAAYVHAQSVAAQAMIEGMKAENTEREAKGLSLAYDGEAFYGVIKEFGIHHNAVLELFRSCY
jgi:hypothetical protein